NRRSSRNKLVQKLQTLGLQFRPEKTHARNVAPRPIKARNEAGHDRIAGVDKDNRNLRGCRFGNRRCRCIRGDDSHFKMYKIGSPLVEATVLTPSPPIIQSDILIFDVTGFIEPVKESGQVRRVSVWCSAIKESEHRQLRLLRTYLNRPRSHCAA